MSMKKKLGSKLTEGVRQVKSQREPVPAAAPATTTPVAKPAAKPMSVSPVDKPASTVDKPISLPTKSVTPRATSQAETKLNKLHPRRVWPD